MPICEGEYTIFDELFSQSNYYRCATTSLKWDQVGLLQVIGSATSVACALGDMIGIIAGLTSVGQVGDI